MIRNDRQYRIVRSRLDRLQRLEADLTAKADEGYDPIVADLELRAVRGEISQMSQELADYEALKEGRGEIGVPQTVADLPWILIRARIAAGMTQADLAERLGLKSQQIQRYEATDYESASLSRLIEIADALGVQLTPEVAPAETEEELPRLPGLLRDLEQIGLPRDLVTRRILGPISQEQHSVTELAGRLARLFNWEPSETLRADVSFSAAQAAAYKQRKGASDVRAAAYTAWADYLARVTSETIRDLPNLSVPTDPLILHDEIVTGGEPVTLENVLAALWNRGVAVLPLPEPGGFDAAYFRKVGRDVIVVKHSPRLESLWTFDVLHECGHATEHDNSGDRQLVEIQPGIDQSEDPRERRANDYAVAALFGGRAETLFDAVMEAAEGFIPRIKRATQMVARQQAVSQGLLAFHVAHRLSSQGTEWWGTAQNLQGTETDPWQTMRDVFIQRTDWSILGSLDRDLLMRALQDLEVEEINRMGEAP